MKYDFCTLFDKNYLTRGLALYESLLKHCPEFDLWMLCMDDESFGMLTALKLDGIKPIKLSDFEDPALLSVKKTRTPTEYCWMMSSSLPLYLLEKKGLEMITYLDADMYFFREPDDIFEEFGGSSIMLIPHWYPAKNSPQEKTSGIYNVGMMTFRNDEKGLTCLRWWKERVIEWCYNRYEDGKMGDQLYLNDWPARFEGVHVLKNRGADIASWNMKGYDFFKKNNELWLKVKSTAEEFPVIFYHYHGLKIYINWRMRVVAYPITILQKEIYDQYIKALYRAYKKVWEVNPSWKYSGAPKLNILRYIKQTLVYLVGK